MIEQVIADELFQYININEIKFLNTNSVWIAVSVYDRPPRQRHSIPFHSLFLVPHISLDQKPPMFSNAAFTLTNKLFFSGLGFLDGAPNKISVEKLLHEEVRHELVRIIRKLFNLMITESLPALKLKSKTASATIEAIEDGEL